MATIGGSVKPGDLSAGEVFAQRLTEVRKKRGWTQAQLAERIAERGNVGMGTPLHRVRLGKLEKDPVKARRVTLEEVLAISYALDVSPLYMVTPLEQFDAPRLAVAGSVQPVAPDDARAWLRGEKELWGQDPFVFAAERPDEDIPEAMTRGGPGVLAQWRRSFQYPKEER